MANTENEGCLGFLLRLFRIPTNNRGNNSKSPNSTLPYRLRDDFLSNAELSFHGVLRQAVQNRAAICTKVNLADLFYVIDKKNAQTQRNKIDRKHVDFLLCDPKTMRPLVAIELDDSSHDRTDRRDRDSLVNLVFKAANLPLIRQKAQSAYSVIQLQQALEEYLTRQELPIQKPALISNGETPICTKCGIPMTKRIAQKGASKGRVFFGCTNYPRCKEVRT